MGLSIIRRNCGPTPVACGGSGPLRLPRAQASDSQISDGLPKGRGKWGGDILELDQHLDRHLDWHFDHGHRYLQLCQHRHLHWYPLHPRRSPCPSSHLAEILSNLFFQTSNQRFDIPIGESPISGKTGVTADRDKIEFRLFNSSSFFNITLIKPYLWFSELI